jgi:bacterioferritin-associated ferredoxin
MVTECDGGRERVKVAIAGTGMAVMRIIRIHMAGRVGYTVIIRVGERLGVYICLCNALTDRQVKLAAATAGTTRPSAVYAACGCRAQCGQCAKALVNLLRGDGSPILEPSAAN